MKRPNWLLFITLGFLVKIYSFFKGQRIIRTAKIKGPAIVLSNHTSFYDFIYTTAAIYPKRVTYLAASKMFYDPLLGFFLRLARAIPKSLFQSDPVSTMNAFRILKQKGIVSIFPEGQISPIGVTQPINYAIAKLLKKAKVNVYIAKHQGAYLVNPPWNKKTFRGRIITNVDFIISKEQLLDMSEQQIFDVVKEKLHFNTSEFNHDKKFKYKPNDITNLESVIYQCPKCGFDDLKSRTHELYCTQCGHTMSYDQYGKIDGKRIDELYHTQEQVMQKMIMNNPDFKLESNVKLESFKDKRLVEVGEGVLTLDRNEYRYSGTINQEKVVLKFDPKIIASLPSDLGRNIQIYEGYIIYQFVIDKVTLPTKFVIAGEYIHTLCNNKVK